MILVTGASGTVGTELVARLLARGARVRAAVHHPGEILAAAPEAQHVVVDYDRPETLDMALEGCRFLYQVTPDAPDQVRLARNIVNAAARAGVQFLVKQSTLGADTESFEMARRHREIERYIEESGIPHAFLRPNCFMQKFAMTHGESIRREGKFYLAEGDARVSYIHALDVAAAAVEVLLRPEAHAGNAYTLTGPEALTAEEVARRLSATLQREIHYVAVSAEEMIDRYAEAGVPAWLAELLIERAAFHIDNGAAHVTETVLDLTHHRPSPFERFARQYADAFLPPIQRELPLHVRPEDEGRRPRRGERRAGR